jgi:hypothetical protein
MSVAVRGNHRGFRVIDWHCDVRSHVIDVRMDVSHADLMIEALGRLFQDIEVQRMIRDLRRAVDAVPPSQAAGP